MTREIARQEELVEQKRREASAREVFRKQLAHVEKQLAELQARAPKPDDDDEPTKGKKKKGKKRHEQAHQEDPRHPPPVPAHKSSFRDSPRVDVHAALGDALDRLNTGRGHEPSKFVRHPGGLPPAKDDE